MARALGPWLALVLAAACEASTDSIAAPIAPPHFATGSNAAPVASVTGSFHRPITNLDESP
ncbi:MAG: hypothetical protein ACT4P7_21080, partial [Gemmatimonadaceae bacterium]